MVSLCCDYRIKVGFDFDLPAFSDNKADSLWIPYSFENRLGDSDLRTLFFIVRNADAKLLSVFAPFRHNIKPKSNPHGYKDSLYFLIHTDK